MKTGNSRSMLKSYGLLMASALICLFALALMFDGAALAVGQGNRRTRTSNRNTRPKPTQNSNGQANGNQTSNTQTNATQNANTAGAQNANTRSSGNQSSIGQGSRPAYQVQPPSSDIRLEKHNLYEEQELSDQVIAPVGSEILYRVDFSNQGTGVSRNLSIIDPVQERTDFKLGSAEINPGTTGLTARISYSKDGGEHCDYTPTSGGGGAPAGYDRLVTAVCFTFNGDLNFNAPNNAGSASYLGRRR